MKAYACDNCGKLFSGYGHNKKFFPIFIRNKCTDVILSIRMNDEKQNDFEFCPECLDKILEEALEKLK